MRIIVFIASAFAEQSPNTMSAFDNIKLLSVIFVYHTIKSVQRRLVTKHPTNRCSIVSTSVLQNVQYTVSESFSQQVICGQNVA